MTGASVEHLGKTWALKRISIDRDDRGADLALTSDPTVPTFFLRRSFFTTQNELYIVITTVVVRQQPLPHRLWSLAILAIQLWSVSFIVTRHSRKMTVTVWAIPNYSAKCSSIDADVIADKYLSWTTVKLRATTSHSPPTAPHSHLRVSQELDRCRQAGGDDGSSVKTHTQASERPDKCPQETTRPQGLSRAST